MRYLVDTAWAVWWLRGRPDVVERLRELRTEGLAISAVTLGEYLVLLTENRRHYERVAGLTIRSLVDQA